MRGARYRRRGWFGESHRHYLAAKGVKTGSKVALDFSPVSGRSWVAEAVDSKGRLVRKYPVSFMRRRQSEKFRRSKRLESRLPQLIARLRKDVDSKNEFKRQNAQAALLIAQTGMRPGTEQDTKGDVDAFGVTTLEDKHVKLHNSSVTLRFVGKKGVPIRKSITDKHLVKIIKERKAQPGKQLFTLVNDSSLRNYLNKLGVRQTKDLRTAKANVLAQQYKKRGLSNKEIILKVSAELNNTPGVTKRSYIRPEVLQ